MNLMFARLAVTVIVFLLVMPGKSLLAADKKPIIIRNISVASGTKVTTDISINALGTNTSIPITVINGNKPGPTLLLLAGVHGSEYSPIVAMQKLAPKLDPQNISGAVIIVHIANMPAYLGRTVYTSPIDDKNLNRVFPGNPDGSLTERIAYFLTSDLYPLADAVLDMHSGDGNEQLKPSWTGYYGTAGSEDVIRASRAMAHAFGIEYIVEFQWELTNIESAIWAGSAAIAKNIPSIDVEAGGMGIYDEKAIAQIEEGVRRIMSHLSITDEIFPTKSPAKIITDRQSIKAPENGSWVPLIDAGNKINKGDLIGYMTDWHGNRTFEAKAPIDGLLLLRFEAPPALKGETLAVVARTTE